MICQTRYGIPQIPNHFSEVGILNHKQCHRHGNRIAILRRTLFSLSRYLCIRRRLRLFFACLAFDERNFDYPVMDQFDKQDTKPHRPKQYFTKGKNESSARPV